MSKARINTNSRVGIALRKRPYLEFDESVEKFLENGTIVTVIAEDTSYDILGEKPYAKVKLDSGKEGYVLADALEMI
jgi:hypothetical protein